MRRPPRPLLLLCLWLAGAGALAGRELAEVFGAHMVLQSRQPLPIWGVSRPKQEVTVEFAGQRVITRADDQGRWRAELAPLEPSTTPRVLRVRGEHLHELPDVLVGEVWLCSGQSNMRYTLGRPLGGPAGGGPIPFADELAQADLPQVRLLNVSGGTPEARAWAPASPASARSFSALAWFFGRRLHHELNMPIGLVDLGKGGAPIRAFLPRSALPRLTELRSPPADDDATLATVFEGDLQWFAPYAVRGVLWYQGESDTARAADYPALLGALCAAWREAFTSPQLPFLIVQLPVFERRASEAAAAPDAPPRRAELRAAQQRATAADPHLHLVPALDLGERFDLHPRRKPELAERLATAALARIYGRPLAAAAPTLVAIEHHGNRLTLRFTGAEGGLVVAGEKITALILHDSVGNAREVDGQIEDLDRLVVAVPPGFAAQEISYGWQDFFHPSLFNGYGWPALPFRTAVPSRL